MTDTSVPLPPISWRWIAAFWVAGAAFEASQSIFMLHAEGKDSGDLQLFIVQFFTWLPWALATPLVISLARRTPVIPRPTARGVLTHLGALIVISLIAEAWSSALVVAFNPWVNTQPPTFWNTFSTTLIFQALNCLTAYSLILAITYLVDSRDRVARQTAEAARLNGELSTAQLAALRRQLEPHFMFNTLNSIAGLVRDQRNAAAVSMIVGLSEFLRRASEDSHRPQVTLAEEVEYLQRYIDIQKLRFGDRLRIGVEIAPGLMEAQVPGLVLQPLVENAIKHGVARRVAGGTVRVRGQTVGTALCLSVYNDGADLPGDGEDDDEEKGAGVGLANLRTRLQILHGSDAELRIDRIGDDGVEVTVTLPGRRA